jgi:uncharacterized membrane protein YhaH (DUF805 family)
MGNKLSTCPVCGCTVELHDRVTVCPACKIAHHEECWRENKGCSTYGCTKVNALNPPMKIDIPVDPNYGNPNYGNPNYGNPNYGNPNYGNPNYGNPNYGQPTAYPQYSADYFDANALGIGWTDIMTKKFSLIRGRARRKEYWMFQAVNFLIMIVICFTVGVIGGAAEVDEEAITGMVSVSVLLFWLVILCPSINLLGRRLHDIGWSAWPILLIFVPYIGGFILFIVCCIDSERGNNKYGPNPKGIN